MSLLSEEGFLKENKNPACYKEFQARNYSFSFLACVAGGISLVGASQTIGCVSEKSLLITHAGMH